MPGKVRNGRLVCGEEMPEIKHIHLREGQVVVCEASPNHKGDHFGSVNLSSGYLRFWWRFTPPANGRLSPEFLWRMKRYKDPFLTILEERQK